MENNQVENSFEQLKKLRERKEFEFALDPNWPGGNSKR